MAATRDPSPEEIAAASLLIQAGWSERRMPSCRLEADGSLCSRQAGFSCDYDNSTGNGDYLLQNSFIKNSRELRGG
jgi:hypothetical protein